MATIEVTEVKTKKEEKDFIRLPWKIYENDPCWVPPLMSDVKKSIHGENNSLKESGPYKLLLAYKNGDICGRMCIGINEHLNEAKGYKEGYISLFESINDFEVSKKLFDYAFKWFKKMNMEKVIGPISLPNGDDNRGVLIDNFEDPTLVMNIYNKPYYRMLFEDYGFEKYWDCYAYKYKISKGVSKRYKDIVPYAMDKYKFTLDMFNLKKFDQELDDIKKVIDKAMPEEWEDFIPPTEDEIRVIGENLAPVIDPELIYIARNNEGEPIGFNIALPDYNQVLKHLNGKITPFGFLKYLYYKRKITRARLFVLFVIPEYRRKGVASAIYLKTLEVCEKRGYTYGEGSTVWEYNKTMQRDIEKLGGKLYKTYRIYKKKI
ncbi:hypothetical protein CLPU_10c00310 [Gottschalkia purinilytica]|uniref:N-acetyltransferase domain-containing protein n=1 Tax=Gottschalkia purinilytica TaxID=1503 RepID=A0A0L0W965_GOTPU|nr:GNAT family N-acetyltransferase [Gottschalkia purinilytica]KNF07977.1 hypothetical protein CLPU_10c00310 [Gottschalkia purinilytica]